MLPNNCKIMLYNKVVDMRKSIDGLSIIVSDVLSLNPSDGSIYIFCNKNNECSCCRNYNSHSRAQAIINSNCRRCSVCLFLSPVIVVHKGEDTEY